MKTNKNGVKLLAAVMAMVMAFAAVAVVVDTSESDAASSDITYLGGTITGNAEQTFGPGSNVVVEKDLVIPADKTLIIGGKFTVNEGAELTIKGTLVIEPSASATFNADVTVENGGKIYNSAFYDGTNKVNGSYIGFFVNAGLTIEKGGEINGTKAVTITDPATPTGTEVTTTLDAKGIASNGKNGETVDFTPTTKEVTNTTTHAQTLYLYSTTKLITYHMNGAGNMGYWVGVQIKLTDATDGDVKVSYDGRSSDSTETVAYGKLNLWFAAGQVIPMKVVYDTASEKKTLEFTVDTTGCVTKTTGIIAGQIIIGENGSFSMNSSKASPAYLSNQNIVIKEGASVQVNGIITDVEVSAFGTGIYTYGKAFIENEVTENILNLRFGVVSEKIPAAYNSSAKPTTKAVNNILTVSGTIEAGYALTVEETKAIAGAGKTLHYADAEGEDSEIPMTGIVRIAQETELKVVAGAALITETGSILEVAGKLTATGTKDTTDSDKQSTVTIAGFLKVPGTVDIAQIVTTGGAVNLDLSGSYVIVTGSVTIVEGADLTNTPTGVSGALYVDDEGVLHIVTLPAAIAAGADEIIVSAYGEEQYVALAQPTIVSKDLTIPDDVKLDILYELIVSEGVTLTISEDADISSTVVGLIVVQGVVIDYSMADLDYPDTITSGLYIVSEIRSMDADETYLKYTTLADALATATSGSVIELFGDVKVTNTLTIGSGITVLANGNTLTVLNDSTLIVDGILDLVFDIDGEIANDALVELTNEDTDKFKAAGKLVNNNIIVLDSDAAIKDTEGALTLFISGIYAYGDVAGYEGQNYILAPAVAAENSKTLEDLAINTKTEYSGDLVFDGGDEAQEITINVAEEDADVSAKDGKFSVGKITLRNYSLIVGEGALFNGTVAGANGTVKTVNIMGDTTAHSTVTFTDKADAEKGTDVLTITGKPTMVKADGTTTGVSATNNTAAITIIEGTVVSGEFNAENLKSFTINEGTTLNITNSSAAVKFQAASLTVDGTVNVLKYGTLNVTTLTINGTVYVKAATAEDTSKGTLTATTVFVGTNAKSTTGTTATLTADAVGNLSIIYVANGSTVSEKIIEDIPYTEFYVEDALWMTVYQKTGGTVKVTDIKKAPVTDADFKGWMDAKDKAITATDDLVIGAVGAEKIYAVIDYNVYSVKVVGDNGIGTVSIDGVVLVKVSNTFTASGITAGTHTIIVETKNGYGGTVTMTMDGNTLSDGKFTLSGDKSTDRNKTIIISGTEPIVEPVTPVEPTEKDDGMGITEYLLIVLVVLAAILVVIVAIRMMRS